tara:strand:- start:1284 stop:1697 length:414 start_codon:yes stop_codon:yes gene_type:complete
MLKSEQLVLCIAHYLFLHTFVKKEIIMNIDNTKAQMRKGVLEFCILTILADKDKYTSEILSTLKSSKMLVVEGTIYPLLNRLKNSGLLEYRWEESTSGPPRKYYKITKEGKLFLSELAVTWEELFKAVNTISKSNHK